MAHEKSHDAEKMLDKEFKVLDHGFVRLVDYLGGDKRIVESARVSYGEGTKTVREDKALIEYLISHQHTSPFEQVIVTLHCKLPIFVARQWIRHRTARVNEISGRYSILKDEFYVPDENQIGLQSKDNRQGRSTEDVPDDLKKKIHAILLNDQKNAYQKYRSMIDDSIARELSRINLPLSLYTEWYWQSDLHNLFNFLKLRLDYHAQWEIQQYAKAVANIAKAVAPMAYSAFEKHVLNAVRFSGKEVEALAKQIQGKEHNLKGIIKTEYDKKIKKVLKSINK